MDKPLALVIEDTENQAITFDKALDVAGYKTEVIMQGDRAQQRLTEVVPHLVVLDLHMPHVSGEMLLKQIRADTRLAGTHVFLATADALLAETLREMADLVLLKPVSFGQLVGLANRFHKRARRPA